MLVDVNVAFNFRIQSSALDVHVTALGVLCCMALFDLACFFLPSFISRKHVYTCTCTSTSMHLLCFFP